MNAEKEELPTVLERTNPLGNGTNLTILGCHAINKVPQESDVEIATSCGKVMRRTNQREAQITQNEFS